MKRLNPEDIRELQRKGERVYDDDGKPYLNGPPRRVQAATESNPSLPPPVPPQNDVSNTQHQKTMESVLDIMRASEANTHAVIQVIGELAKPKPKKKWGCVVSRNTAGQINNVDIEEK
jgi:hypothetical protein